MQTVTYEYPKTEYISAKNEQTDFLNYLKSNPKQEKVFELFEFLSHDSKMNLNFLKDCLALYPELALCKSVLIKVHTTDEDLLVDILCKMKEPQALIGLFYGREPKLNLDGPIGKLPMWQQCTLYLKVSLAGEAWIKRVALHATIKDWTTALTALQSFIKERGDSNCNFVSTCIRAFKSKTCTDEEILNFFKIALENGDEDTFILSYDFLNEKNKVSLLIELLSKLLKEQGAQLKNIDPQLLDLETYKRLVKISLSSEPSAFSHVDFKFIQEKMKMQQNEFTQYYKTLYNKTFEKDENYNGLQFLSLSYLSEKDYYDIVKKATDKNILAFAYIQDPKKITDYDNLRQSWSEATKQLKKDTPILYSSHWVPLYQKHPQRCINRINNYLSQGLGKDLFRNLPCEMKSNPHLWEKILENCTLSEFLEHSALKESEEFNSLLKEFIKKDKSKIKKEVFEKMAFGQIKSDLTFWNTIKANITVSDFLTHCTTTELSKVFFEILDYFKDSAEFKNLFEFVSLDCLRNFFERYSDDVELAHYLGLEFLKKGSLHPFFSLKPATHNDKSTNLAYERLLKTTEGFSYIKNHGVHELLYDIENTVYDYDSARVRFEILLKAIIAWDDPGVIKKFLLEHVANSWLNNHEDLAPRARQWLNFFPDSNKELKHHIKQMFLKTPDYIPLIKDCDKELFEELADIIPKPLTKPPPSPAIRTPFEPYKENADLYEYPRDIISIPKHCNEVSIGDMHGNALKSLWVLIKSGIVTLPQHRYETFVELYKKYQQSNFDSESNDEIQEDLQSVTTIFSEIQRGENYLLHFRKLGDTRADRGVLDLWQIELDFRLIELGIKSTEIISNHNLDFTKSVIRTLLNEITKTVKITTEDVSVGAKRPRPNRLDYFNTDCCSILEEQRKSLENLRKLILKNVVDPRHVLNMVVITLLHPPQNKLLDYSINSEKHIINYDHAPLDPEQWEQCLTALLKDEYDPKSENKQFTEAVDNANKSTLDIILSSYFLSFKTTPSFFLGKSPNIYLIPLKNRGKTSLFANILNLICKEEMIFLYDTTENIMTIAAPYFNKWDLAFEMRTYECKEETRQIILGEFPTVTAIEDQQFNLFAKQLGSEYEQYGKEITRITSVEKDSDNINDLISKENAKLTTSIKNLLSNTTGILAKSTDDISNKEAFQKLYVVEAHDIYRRVKNKLSAIALASWNREFKRNVTIKKYEKMSSVCGHSMNNPPNGISLDNTFGKKAHSKGEFTILFTENRPEILEKEYRPEVVDKKLATPSVPKTDAVDPLPKSFNQAPSLPKKESTNPPQNYGANPSSLFSVGSQTSSPKGKQNQIIPVIRKQVTSPKEASSPNKKQNTKEIFNNRAPSFHMQLQIPRINQLPETDQPLQALINECNKSRQDALDKLNSLFGEKINTKLRTSLNAVQQAFDNVDKKINGKEFEFKAEEKIIKNCIALLRKDDNPKAKEASNALFKLLLWLFILTAVATFGAAFFFTALETSLFIASATAALAAAITGLIMASKNEDKEPTNVQEKFSVFNRKKRLLVGFLQKFSEQLTELASIQQQIHQSGPEKKKNNRHGL